MTLQSLVFLITLLYYALIFHPLTASNPTYLDSRCSNNTTFAPNSNYQSNLSSVFFGLTSKAATNSAGNTTNNDVYGLYLCRGDLSTESCKTCVEAATAALSVSYCPFKKAGVIWYAECMVRYSNESFYGRMVESPKLIFSNGRYINGNETRFSEDLENNMNELVVQAGIRMSKRTYLEKVVKITEFQMLHVFGQCTPDLTGNDCARCLKIAVSRLPVGIIGRVLFPSCNLWYEVYESNNSSSNLKIKSQTGKKQIWTEVIVATIIPVASISVAVLALCLMLKKARKSARRVVDEEWGGIESLQHNLSTLQRATNNFSPDKEIGQGGFGTVYKGILSDGREVAVKRMRQRNTFLGEQGFRNEVLYNAKLQHRNLVRLLGFCSEEEERLLVFEYVPYNLNQVLFNAERNVRLDWRSRFHIIMGIAKGMLYLHQDSRLRIVHHDLKVDNVLLDEHMNPKIAEFGWASIFHATIDDSVTRVVGTIGYICPEFLINGRHSVQSDVYSFGVLMLEIICGRRWRSFQDCANTDIGILSYAREKWREGRVLEFVDFVDEAINDYRVVSESERCIHLGLLCVEEYMDQRPTMATVVLMLESQSAILPMPEQPAYMFSHGEPEQSTTTPMLWSLNNDSITEIEPR